MDYTFLENPTQYNTAQYEAAFVIEGNPTLMDQFLTAQKNIKWVHSAMAGLDWILCDRLRQSQINLTNAKGCYNESLAEFVTYSMIHFAKRMPEHIVLKRQHQFTKQVVKNTIGCTVTIIGYGSIGTTTAKMLKQALRCKIIGVTQDKLVSKEQRINADEIIADNQYDEALKISDYVE